MTARDYDKVRDKDLPEDWDIGKIGGLFSVSAGRDFDPSRSSPDQTSKYPYPVYANGLSKRGLHSYCSYADHPEGAITVTARGTLGVAYYRESRFTAVGRLLVLEPRTELEGRYFAAFINQEVDFAIESTGVPQLTAPQISQRHVAVPPPDEQEAIAEALSDVDALLTSIDAAIEKKRNVKTATMQRLMTEGERLSGYGTERTAKKLGEVTVDIVGGGTPSRSKAAYWGGDIPWMTVKDFNTFDPSATQESITKTGLRRSASSLVPAGTVITSTRMALGEVAIYDVPVAINQDLKALFTTEDISDRFLFYWFQCNSRRIKKMGSGSTVKGLAVGDLKELEIRLPSIEEQRAIAKVLSDMDAEIEAWEKRRAKTEAVKTGMMQELVTGETRLV